MAHDPQLCTFDNNGGAGDGIWDTAINWTGAVPDEIPEDGDSVKLSANCTCDSDESAAVLSGGDSTVDANVTLTMATGGHIKFQDRSFVFNTTAVLAFDGGVITFKTTGATAKIMGVKTMTGTAAGGTLNLPSDTANKSELYWGGAVSWIGNSTAHRIKIDGSGGTANGYVSIQYGGGSVVNYIEFANLGKIEVVWGLVAFRYCIAYGFIAAGYGFYLSGGSMSLRDTYVYNADSACLGAVTLVNGYLFASNLICGKTEADAASGNVIDILASGGSTVFADLYNCKLESTTPVSVGSGAYTHIISNAHGQVKDTFRAWYGRGHTVEFTDSGQTGNGLVLITSSAAGIDSDYARLRYCIGILPAKHGDTIDATVYVENAASKTCRVIIDPDSLFGTTQNQSGAVASVNWEQRTIPTYTVNTTAGKKHAIPVYIDLYGASETWYVDTMAAKITSGGRTISYEHVFDGVPVNDPVAGVLKHPGMAGGFNG